MIARPVSLLLLILLAFILASCGRTDLSRQDAAKLLETSTKLDEYKSNLLLQDNAERQGIALGWWQMQGGAVINLSPIIQSEGSAVNHAMFGFGKAYLVLNKPAVISVTVTGIAGDKNQTTRTVNFDWQYKDLQPLSRRIAVQGGKGDAVFHLYDDGWRLAELLSMTLSSSPYPLSDQDKQDLAKDLASQHERRVAAEQVATVSTDLYTAEISSQGGDLVRLELKAHRDLADDSTPFVLFDSAEKHIYLVQSGLIGEGMPNHKTMWQLPVGNHVMKDGENEVRLRLESHGTNGAKITKTYKFHRGSYEIELLHEGAPRAYTYYQMITRGGKPTVDSSGEMKGANNFIGAAVYTEYEKFQKVNLAEIEKGNVKYAKLSSDGWIAIVQPRFLTALLVQDKLPRENFMRKTGNDRYAVGVIIPAGANGHSSIKLYAGPQQNMAGKITPGLDLVAK